MRISDWSSDVCASDLTGFVSQLLTAGERAEVARKEAAAAAGEARIAQYRDRVAEIAADLDERQAQLEEWKDTYFGSEALPADAAPKAGAKDAAEAQPVETSALDPRLPPEAQEIGRAHV